MIPTVIANRFSFWLMFQSPPRRSRITPIDVPHALIGTFAIGDKRNFRVVRRRRWRKFHPYRFRDSFRLTRLQEVFKHVRLFAFAARVQKRRTVRCEEWLIVVAFSSGHVFAIDGEKLPVVPVKFEKEDIRLRKAEISLSISSG